MPSIYFLLIPITIAQLRAAFNFANIFGTISVSTEEPTTIIYCFIDCFGFSLVSSIKPIDKETIIKCAKGTDILISFEDHSIVGGIGSIISNVLTEEYPKKLIKLGVKDKFGKSGDIENLYKIYGITKEEILNKFLDL